MDIVASHFDLHSNLLKTLEEIVPLWQTTSSVVQSKTTKGLQTARNQ